MDLNPIHHLLSSQKMKCSYFDYVQLLMIGRAGQWTQTPSATPLQPIKWNAHFWITFNFWWSARLVDGLKPHPPPLSSQKNEMLIFWLCSTSDDQPGWSMDSNPICHPSPANKMKCFFLDYVQLLMISQAGWWTQTPSATPLQPKNEMLIFVLCSTSDDRLGWSMDSNPIHHPSPAKKWNAHFCITFNIWCWPDWSMDLNPSTTPLPKKWNPHFCITFNFWCQPGLVDGLKPHLPPSPAKKMKCSFLDFVQLLMISQAGQWTQTPSTTPVHPKKWNAHFWITFNFWWSAGLVDGLEPHPPPLSSQKMKCSYFDYVQLLMIGLAVQWTQTPSTTPLQPKKWNAHFWVMFNFWWLVRLVDELKPHLPPLSSQKNEMLIFVLRSTSDDQPGLLMDLNPIHHLSPAKKNEMLIFWLCSTSDDLPG